MATKAKKANKAKKAGTVSRRGGVRRSGDDGLKAVLEDHAEALREHAYELRRNSLALRATLSKGEDAGHESVTDAAFVRETVVAGGAAEQIKRRIAAATGNSPEALKDDFKVIWMMTGGPAIRDNFMSRINNAFWPGDPIPHLKFNEVKGLTIGLLIAVIQKRL